MKILLISFNQQDVEECKVAPTDISTMGIRYLSSYLKAAGHDVNILFLCKYFGEKENEEEILQILEFVKNNNYDLIGMGLMSNHFFRASSLTLTIKKNFPDTPIIWGGIHPTIKPKKCLEFADIVCLGEGELAFAALAADLANFKSAKIPGIWYKNGNEIVEAGHGQLICDINTLPHPDFDLTTQYIIHQDKLQVFTDDILKQYYPFSRGDHRLLSSRGCPHACAYCCSSVFRNLYGGGYLRRRTVDDFISEMLEMKNSFPFIKYFKIMDDSFSFNTLEWLQDFNKQYKEKIDFPFYCLASPQTLEEEKLKLLLDAGLETIQLGLQSGSDRINHEIYLRHARSEDFLKAIKMVEKYSDKLGFIIDVIVDNPYEREEDKLQTIRVLNEIKKPFNQAMYSLAVYPGTALYDRVMNDNLMPNKDEYLAKQFHLLKQSLLNKITYLTPRMPKSTIEWLLDNRHHLVIRLCVSGLYLAYTKKNDLPAPLMSLALQLKKKFLKMK